MRGPRRFPGGIRPDKRPPGRCPRSGRAREARCQGRAGRRIVWIQQPLHRHAHKGRIGDIAVTVGVHQALQLGEGGPGLGAVRTQGDVRRPLGHGQQLQHRHSAGRRRRDADHIDPVGPAKGPSLDRLIGGNVRDRQGAGARLLRHRGGDLARDPATIEDLGPACRQLGHGPGIGRILQHITRGIALAVSAGEIGTGPARPRLPPRRSDETGQPRADHKAVTRQPLRIAEQGAPGQAAMRRLGHGQHGYGPGRAGRTAAQDRVADPERPAVLEEQFGRRGRGGGFAAVIACDLTRPGVEHHHEGTAAEAG